MATRMLQSQLTSSQPETTVSLSQNLSHVDVADPRLALGSVLNDRLIFGTSLAMEAIRTRLRTVALSNVPVLIHGESGTGKEVIELLIICISSVQNVSFVNVSCPAV